MAPVSESAYRAARRAFIAACDSAHVDAIARLNPAKAPDGKPLFMDAAAFGPRLATRALMVIAADVGGSALLVALLKEPLALPPGTRLVLVHALDPAAFAGVEGDPAWPAAMLAAVAREDMARVQRPVVLPLGDAGQQAILATAQFQTAVTILAPAASLAEAQAAIAAFLRG